MAQSPFHRDDPYLYRERVLRDAERAKKMLASRGVTPQTHDIAAAARRATDRAEAGGIGYVDAYADEILRLRPDLYKRLYGDAG